MKTVGLITEYNPFHNGHLYHIEKAKEVTGADQVVIIMSGNFVQRGIPAIMPKRIRTEMALRCGASAVFELPVCYATGSAELFAMGAVSFLDMLGIVDAVCFGSESGNLEDLKRIADVLIDEPKPFKKALRKNLQSGMNYPAARQDALHSYWKENDISFLLDSPNNILAIEYLKALRRLDSKILPYTIRRVDSDYHETELNDGYSSASAIRRLLSYTGNSFEQLETQVPSTCYQLLQDNYKIHYPVHQTDFSLLYKHIFLKENKKQLKRYADMDKELVNRIKNQLNDFTDIEQFCELLNTRDTTLTKINRACLHALLNIKKSDIEKFTENGYHYYAHLLGFRQDRAKVLTQIKEQGKIPLLPKLTKTEELSAIGRKMLKKDIFASNLYESAVTERYRTTFCNELSQQIVRV